MNITFNFQKQVTLKNRTALKHFIAGIFSSEKRNSANISFVFCTDEYLLEINKSFLHHDFYTDIITFDLTASGSKNIEAEVYISVDRVLDNSKTFKSTLKSELHRVIFHGVLHLCGYGDKTTKAKTLMTAMENKYLNLYGIK